MVDEGILSIDTNDTSQTLILELIPKKHPDDQLIFANGGDRTAGLTLPENEYDMCVKCNIEMVYGVGGTHKADSSTRINQAIGHESK